MSKLLIDKCIQEHISPNDLMILYALIYKIKGIPFSEDEKKLSVVRLGKLLLIKDGQLTDKGKRIVTDYTNALHVLEGKGKITNKAVDKAKIEAEIKEFVEEYRNLFKGYKVGAKGDKNGCVAKLMTFYQEYPEYANKEIILRATKMYLNNLNDYRYVKHADYFIYKHDLNKNKTSTLATFCGEVDLDKPEKKRSFIDVL